MKRLLLLLLVAWLAGPPASHAQSPELAKALADLAIDNADTREAAVAVIGGTRDPKWLDFLAALRDGKVYARGKGKDLEVVVGGAKTTKGDAGGRSRSHPPTSASLWAPCRWPGWSRSRPTGGCASPSSRSSMPTRPACSSRVPIRRRAAARP